MNLLKTKNYLPCTRKNPHECQNIFIWEEIYLIDNLARRLLKIIIDNNALARVACDKSCDYSVFYYCITKLLKWLLRKTFSDFYLESSSNFHFSLNSDKHWSLIGRHILSCGIVKLLSFAFWNKIMLLI